MYKYTYTYIVIYIYPIFFIHSFVDAHLDCFHIMAVSFFPQYVPRNETASQMVASVSVFLRNCHTIFYRGCTNLYSHQQLYFEKARKKCKNILSSWKVLFTLPIYDFVRYYLVAISSKLFL